MKTETAKRSGCLEAQRSQPGARAVTRPQRMADVEGVGKTRRLADCGLLRAVTARAPLIASLLLCVFALIPSALCAVTNDLSGLLQKGLFEEEANRNLDAAAQAYVTVSAQFDKDRKLAATAIFRLGEIYRKQGKTNEAVGQYERIVREFADQDTLVTLSRQNVAGMRAKQTTSSAVESNPTRSLTGDADLQKLKSLSPAELRQVLPTLVPDQLLIKLLEQLNSTQTKRTEQINDLGPSHPQIKSLDAVLEVVNKQIDDRIAGIIKALEIRAATTETARVQTKSQNSSDSSATANYDPYAEESEIDRIRALVQNSPDLINGTPGQSSLITAVSAGWLRVVNFLLDNGANVNAVSGGKTALHQAVGNGNKAMIEVLLKRGAEINTKDGTGGTALHEAAQNGFLSIAEVLLKHKADLNARNSKQNGEQSPLHLAAKNGHGALVGFLLANGDDVNRKDAGGETPLHTVAANGRDGLVERLLKAGADVNATDNAGETPLMNAADNGHSASVKALLAAKANPDFVDKKGRTALSYAVGRGHAEVVKLLLDAKADVNAGTAESPLLLAVRADNLMLAETLLRLDADPNQVTECDILRRNGSPPSPLVPANYRAIRTPLQIAVFEEHPAMVKILLRFKGDAHAKGDDGDPLILKTLGSVEMLKAFLDAGGDANAAYGKGGNALMAAAGFGNASAVKMLLEHKADVNAHAPGSSTPLHRATMNGSKEVVEMLLAHGADPNVRAEHGLTALDYTKQSQAWRADLIKQNPTLWREMGDLLRNHGALDDLPDFKSIRITRQGLALPLDVFKKGPLLTNQFTLLETVMSFYNRKHVFGSGSGAQGAMGEASQVMPFPDFGRIIIRRPSAKPGGKDQEIKVSLLNNSNAVDCVKDVPVEFGDVIEISERVHALNESTDDPVSEMEWGLIRTQPKTETIRRVRLGNSLPGTPQDRTAYGKANTNANWSCLLLSVQLVVAGERASVTADSWKEGFLSQVLRKTEARAVLRSSSDLSRVKVTRKDAKSGKPVVLTVDVSDNPQRNDDLWLLDGDVIEVPDKP